MGYAAIYYIASIYYPTLAAVGIIGKKMNPDKRCFVSTLCYIVANVHFTPSYADLSTFCAHFIISNLATLLRILLLHNSF